jgi:hypothetical protein
LDFNFIPAGYSLRRAQGYDLLQNESPQAGVRVKDSPEPAPVQWLLELAMEIAATVGDVIDERWREFFAVAKNSQDLELAAASR